MMSSVAFLLLVGSQIVVVACGQWTSSTMVSVDELEDMMSVLGGAETVAPQQETAPETPTKDSETASLSASAVDSRTVDSGVSTSASSNVEDPCWLCTEAWCNNK